MIVSKSGQGNPYQAPAHFGQWGAEYIKAGESSRLSIRVSHFLPDGGAEMGKVPEMAFYVLSGSIQVKGKEEEHILNAGDVVHFSAGEERALKVCGQVPASILVIIVMDRQV